MQNTRHSFPLSGSPSSTLRGLITKHFITAQQQQNQAWTSQYLWGPSNGPSLPQLKQTTINSQYDCGFTFSAKERMFLSVTFWLSSSIHDLYFCSVLTVSLEYSLFGFSTWQYRAWNCEWLLIMNVLMIDESWLIITGAALAQWREWVVL